MLDQGMATDVGLTCWLPNTNILGLEASAYVDR